MSVTSFSGPDRDLVAFFEKNVGIFEVVVIKDFCFFEVEKSIKKDLKSFLEGSPSSIRPWSLSLFAWERTLGNISNYDLTYDFKLIESNWILKMVSGVLTATGTVKVTFEMDYKLKTGTSHTSVFSTQKSFNLSMKEDTALSNLYFMYLSGSNQYRRFATQHLINRSYVDYCGDGRSPRANKLATRYSVEKQYGKKADFYREVSPPDSLSSFTTGTPVGDSENPDGTKDNSALPDGDSARNIGRPSPDSPNLKYRNLDKSEANGRTPANKLDLGYVHDSGSGSARVIPYDSGFENNSSPLRNASTKVKPMFLGSESGAMAYDFYFMRVEKDYYYHYTYRDRAEEIIEDGHLRPNFYNDQPGAKGAYAISGSYGQEVTSLQVSGSRKEHMDKIVALKFKTRTEPKYGYPEEVIWDKPVKLIRPEIVGVSKAVSDLNRNEDLGENFKVFYDFKKAVEIKKEHGKPNAKSKTASISRIAHRYLQSAAQPAQDLAGVKTWVDKNRQDQVQNDTSSPDKSREDYEDGKPQRDRVLPLPNGHPEGRDEQRVGPGQINSPPDSSGQGGANRPKKDPSALNDHPDGKALHERPRSSGMPGDEYGHPYIDQSTSTGLKRRVMASIEKISYVGEDDFYAEEEDFYWDIEDGVMVKNALFRYKFRPPKGNKRQRSQKGQAKRKSLKNKRKNRVNYRRNLIKQKRLYKRKKHNPTYKKYKKNYAKNPERYKRRPGGGVSTPKQKSQRAEKRRK